MIVFDIETIPQPGIEDCPAWKRHTERSLRRENMAIPLQAAALVPEFAQIVCITALYGNPATNKIYAEFSSCGMDESNILEGFTGFIKTCNTEELGGHFIKGFDIPMFAKRCMAHSMRIPHQFRVAGKKPWEIVHTDTAELMMFGGYVRTSLDACCKLLGIKSPKEHMDALGVWDAMKSGDFNKVTKYCFGDSQSSFDIIHKAIQLGAI